MTSAPFEEIIYERVYSVTSPYGIDPAHPQVDAPTPAEAANEVERRLAAGASSISVYRIDRPKR